MSARVLLVLVGVSLALGGCARKRHDPAEAERRMMELLVQSALEERISLDAGEAAPTAGSPRSP